MPKSSVTVQIYFVEELKAEEVIAFVDGLSIQKHPRVERIRFDTDRDEVDCLMNNNGGLWGEHEDHNRVAWRESVAKGLTTQGYWEWVNSFPET